MVNIAKYDYCYFRDFQACAATPKLESLEYKYSIWIFHVAIDKSISCKFTCWMILDVNPDIQSSVSQEEAEEGVG